MRPLAGSDANKELAEEGGADLGFSLRSLRGSVRLLTYQVTPANGDVAPGDSQVSRACAASLKPSRFMTRLGRMSRPNMLPPSRFMKRTVSVVPLGSELDV